MKILFPLFGLMLFLCCNQPIEKTSATTPLQEKLDSLITAKHANNQFDGCIVIGDSNRIIYQKSIGIANRTWDVSMQNNNRFDIASLNKSFQAALILLAAEEGKLQLDDKLYKFFPNQNFDTTISIHQILSHTSGLGDYSSLPEEYSQNNFLKFKRMHFSNEEYLELISAQKMNSKPGSSFHYSNFGYHLLAILLEEVYQKPFKSLLQEKICKPLELSNTYAEINNEVVHKNLVTGYNFNPADSNYYSNGFIDLSIGRRIFSTAEDLYKWAIGLKGLLNSDSYQKMTSNHLAEINSSISYGYGFVVFDRGNYRMGNLGISKNYIIHGGNTEGYKSLLVNIEEGETVISILSNIGDRTNEIEFCKEIITVLQ